MTYPFDDARAYINKVRWHFATTMVDIPHEYTIRAWRRELDAEFQAFAQLIQSTGIVEPWPVERPKYHNHYLVVDNNKYWAMGLPWGDLGPLEDMSIINRQRHPDPRSMLDDVDPRLTAANRR